MKKRYVRPSVEEILVPKLMDDQPLKSASVVKTGTGQTIDGIEIKDDENLPEQKNPWEGWGGD